MTDLFNTILPLILVFILGQACKRFGIFSKENADLFLKLFFYLALPSMILLSIPQVPLTRDLLFLPLIPLVMFWINLAIALISRRFFELDNQTLGVFLVGSIILNGAFAFPFVYMVYGEQALALAYLFDFGNAVMALSIGYYLACRYGTASKSQRDIYKKFFLSPPLLALCLAIVLNLSDLRIPEAGLELLRILSGLTTPLVLLSLGIYFNPRIVRTGPLLTVISIRMLGGLTLGYLLVTLLGLSGMPRTIALVMALCPSAMNTLAYASMEGLNKEFAASIVSYTTVISMLMMSAMILILQ